MNPLARWLPFLAWLPELRKPGTLRIDFMAGLTGAIVVLPQGVAFATIAGMPPSTACTARWCRASWPRCWVRAARW
ncbi:MAG: SulP family inorganic anion transporter [Burkholderiaceae bacterium]